MSTPATLTLTAAELAAGVLSEESLRDARAAIETRGHLVVANAFPRALIERLALAYAGFLARVDNGFRAGAGIGVGGNRRMIPVEIEPPFDDPALWASPLLLPILRALLGDDCVVNSYGSVAALPGSPAQRPHIDHDFLFLEPIASELPPWAITMVVPLVELDDATGTTALWDGSQRQREAVAGEPLLPKVALGGCYFMEYRLTHGGTENRSHAVRPLLYLVYSRPWFLDERNFYSVPALRLSPESYARVPEGLRPLLLHASSQAPAVRVL